MRPNLTLWFTVALFLSCMPLLGQQNDVRASLKTIPKVPNDRQICFVLYTVHDNTMKLTAQLYPLEEGDPRTVRLEVRRGSEWRQIATADAVEPGWAAVFRVTGWDMTRDVQYRVRNGESAVVEGIIRRNPVEKDRIVVAAFSCDSIYPEHGGSGDRADIIENIKRLKPDLLFFAGDQVYNHDYHLANWLIFGRHYGEITRQYPTITIPDDHDVGHPNLWGAGGRKSNMPTGVDGGYYKPLEYVHMVHRAQTSHLPDPYDPTPIEQGISVYYTSLNWGGISFAILEDRKWKSGPLGLVKHPGKRIDLVTSPEFDPKDFDPPGAQLLGERQIAFLRDWAADWRGAEMKCVLSQTLFACLQTHAKDHQSRIYADLDSNGWPHTARNEALAEMRKGFAFHLTGDQHLASIVHYGIDDWSDANYAFCTPAVSSLFRRWWEPDSPGKNRRPGFPGNTGEYIDGFGNLMTVWAVANPYPEDTDDRLTSRSTGYGIVEFDKTARAITMNCWPRNVDITDPKSRQYPGWPQTITQMDNYGRNAVAYLPTIKVRGMTDPVVQVVDDSGGIVYTLRINGTSFRPKVFREGTYTVRVGESGRMKQFKGIKSLPAGTSGELVVDL